MSEFIFMTDTESETYCVHIVDSMVQLFGISRDEAVGRINRFWLGQERTGHYCVIYHESPDYFAKTIYYGPGVYWWKPGVDLRAQPYP